MVKHFKKPKFHKCMQMMRKRDSAIQEDGFHLIQPYAADFIDDLLVAFTTEQDAGLRCWLLELIGDARSEKAFDILCENLNSSDESLRSWAIEGLKILDTKASRTKLYEAGIKSDPPS